MRKLQEDFIGITLILAVCLNALMSAVQTAFADPTAGGAAYEPALGDFGDLVDTQQLRNDPTNRGGRDTNRFGWDTPPGIRWARGKQLNSGSASGSGPGSGTGGAAEEDTMNFPTNFRRTVIIGSDPLSGLGSVSNDTTFTGIAKNLVSSPLGVWHVAARLIDPGVAEGASASNNLSMQFTSSTLQSLALLRQNYASDPVWGPQLQQELDSCIANKLKEVTGSSSGGASTGGGANTADWVQAVSRCIGFRDTSGGSGAASTGTATGTGTAGSQTMATDGQIFSFADSLFAEEGGSSGGSTGSSPPGGSSGGSSGVTELYLTTYLFGKDSAGSSSTGGTGTAGGTGDPGKWKTAFKGYVGDAIIRFEDTGGGSSTSGSGTSGTATGGAPRRYTELVIERLPPEIAEPDEVYGKLLTSTFDNIKKVLKVRCEKYNDPGVDGSYKPLEAASSSPTGGGTTGGGILAGGGGGCSASSSGKPIDVWRDCFSAEDSIKISFPGFRAKASNLELIFMRAVNRGALVASSGAGTSGTTTGSGTGGGRPQADCEFFGSKFPIDSVEQDDGKVPEEILFIYRMAERIAIGKMLASFMKVEELLNRLTMGNANNLQINALAYNLLYDKVGTRRMLDSQIENITHLNNALEAFARSEGSLVGAGGRGLSKSAGSAQNRAMGSVRPLSSGN